MRTSERRFYVLDKTVRVKKKEWPRRVSVPHGHEISIHKQEQHVKYDMLIPLYELWKDYAKTFIQDRWDTKLLKLDYHGCILHVSKAKNGQLVGISGLVLRETKNTFVLICRDDSMKVIPKAGSILQFVLSGKVCTLYGDNLCMQPALRITKKYKANTIIPELIDSNPKSTVGSGITNVQPT